MNDLVLHATMAMRSLIRRRVALAVLVLFPLVLYAATYDALGRSVRSLVFGISWALSTVAFFAAMSARETDPRLRLAGRRPLFLAGARLSALLTLAAVLVLVFWLVVVIDRDVRSPAGVGLDFAVTAVVAVAFGSAVGAVLRSDLEGTLVLFLFAGLQAVVNPFDSWSRLLPFWSSRELGTVAIDGPEQSSTAAGLLHAAIVVALCGAVVAVGAAGPLRNRHREWRQGFEGFEPT
ncbi:MAG: hypothetical protein AAF962_11760 [Actinomycetota bacterium]